MKNVSVIIRNKNEERWIGHCIQSCLEFLNKPEIIVVDNNSKDSSLEIVRSYKHDEHLEPSIRNYCELKVLNIDDYSPGKSLNMGVLNAKYPTICIISAHSVIKKINLDFLEKSLETYPCVFGKQIPVYRGKKITPRYIWSHFQDQNIVDMFSKLENRYFLHNAFAFYKKEILIKLPFNEDITGKEDRLWAKSLIDIGKNYLYTNELIVEHHYTKDGNTWKGVG